MKFKLFYTPLDSSIQIKHFDEHEEMLTFIHHQGLKINEPCGWLLFRADLTDVFISESNASVQDFLRNKYLWQHPAEYYLMQYEGTENPYKLAFNNIQANTSE